MRPGSTVAAGTAAHSPGTLRTPRTSRARRGLRRAWAAAEFGTTGSIKGVAAPEAAGNATAGTAMGALLALGLPTSATAAIMLAAFQQYGMQPGPLLFERSGELVWTLLASLLIGLVVLVIMNVQFAVLWAKLLYIPRHYLYAGITVLSVLGVYAISSATLDLWVLLLVGLLGFVMRRYQFPLAPVLIAVVLGPLAETELRRALTVAEGDASILVSSPMTIILYSVLAIALVVSAVQHIRHRRERREEALAAANGVVREPDPKPGVQDSVLTGSSTSDKGSSTTPPDDGR